MIPKDLLVVENEKLNNGYLVRNALIFVEGDHSDSKLRGHNFPRERVIQLVNNTNSLIKRGGTIPVLYDHNKSAKNVVGSIDSELEMRLITKSDLPYLVNGHRLGYLVGKLGVFSNNVVLKHPETIEAFKKGIVRTISPGIDLRTEIIREVSIVATPAIPGLSLFNGIDMYDPLFYDYFAEFEMPSYTLKGIYSLDEALEEKYKVDSNKKDFLDLCEVLWDVLLNIRSQYYDPNEILQLSSYNLQQFIAKVLEILQLDSMVVPEPQQPFNSIQGDASQMYLQQQQGLNQMANYSSIEDFPVSYLKMSNKFIV